VRKIDAAWPNSRTRRMYNDLSKRQASVLAHLRTGMTPLNGHLHNIKTAETNLCECGEAAESREHFIFRCSRWSEQRNILGLWTGEDNLSRLFGDKSTTDTQSLNDLRSSHFEALWLLGTTNYPHRQLVRSSRIAGMVNGYSTLLFLNTSNCISC
jgi:hypothetical protein